MDTVTRTPMRVCLRGLLALWLAAVLCLTGACGTTSPPLLSFASGVAAHPALRLLTRGDGAAPQRQIVVEAAKKMLAGAPLEAAGYRFSKDPVGFVRAAYWHAGIELFDRDLLDDSALDGVGIIYRNVGSRGRLHQNTPQVGDLLFLDAHGHGRDVLPAHLCVVESVGPNGTVTALGYFKSGPARIRLNLRRAAQLRSDSQLVNDLLEVSDKEGLSAALFRDFANPY